jgi:hypothetical protein
VNARKNAAENAAAAPKRKDIFYFYANPLTKTKIKGKIILV